MHIARTTRAGKWRGLSSPMDDGIMGLYCQKKTQEKTAHGIAPS